MMIINHSLDTLFSVFPTRRTQTVNSAVLVFWFGLGGLGVSVLGLNLLEVRPLFSAWSSVTWVLASAQAVIGLLGVLFLYRAIALASPTRVMVIRSFEIVFSYILQVIKKSLIRQDDTFYVSR